MIQNLIGNAFKFTEKGTVAINVRKQKETEDALSLLVEVEDTGIGISEEAQAELVAYSGVRVYCGECRVLLLLHAVHAV